MQGTASPLPQSALGAARRAGRRVRSAVETLPRITALLGELAETGRSLERLSTFAAQELPEIVHQLEGVRGQLSAIEQRLDALGALDAVNTVTPVTGPAATPGSRRTG